jgi:hypothetical protein
MDCGWMESRIWRMPWHERPPVDLGTAVGAGEALLALRAYVPPAQHR